MFHKQFFKSASSATKHTPIRDGDLGFVELYALDQCFVSAVFSTIRNGFSIIIEW